MIPMSSRNWSFLFTFIYFPCTFLQDPARKIFSARVQAQLLGFESQSWQVEPYWLKAELVNLSISTAHFCILVDGKIFLSPTGATVNQFIKSAKQFLEGRICTPLSHSLLHLLRVKFARCPVNYYLLLYI